MFLTAVGFQNADLRIYVVIKLWSFLAEHKYNLRIGNVSIVLTKEDKEVAVITLTQFNLCFTPTFATDSYKVLLKVEGIIIEGSSLEEHLVPIIHSEHLSDSPAYFLKIEFEKTNHGPENVNRKLSCTLSTVEILYHQVKVDNTLR